jgi:hypothetical protein
VGANGQEYLEWADLNNPGIIWFTPVKDGKVRSGAPALPDEPATPMYSQGQIPNLATTPSPAGPVPATAPPPSSVPVTPTAGKSPDGWSGFWSDVRHAGSDIVHALRRHKRDPVPDPVDA